MIKKIKKVIKDIIYEFDLSEEEEILFKFIGCGILILIISSILIILW